MVKQLIKSGYYFIKAVLHAFGCFPDAKFLILNTFIFAMIHI